jgi:polysaccharide export outer membrane protein
MARLMRTFTAVLVGLWASIAVTSGAQAQQAYQLRAGDTLRLEVLEDQSLNRLLLIAPDGQISVPLVGGVKAAGRTIAAVQADLASQLSPNFATVPTVFVALEAQRARVPGSSGRTIDIFVLGEVNSPGKREVDPDTIVLQLLAETGGFTRFAATKRLQLRRGGDTFPLNYNDIEAGISQDGMMRLRDGDVLVVPQRRLFE